MSRKTVAVSHKRKDGRGSLIEQTSETSGRRNKQSRDRSQGFYYRRKRGFITTKNCLGLTFPFDQPPTPSSRFLSPSIISCSKEYLFFSFKIAKYRKKRRIEGSSRFFSRSFLFFFFFFFLKSGKIEGNFLT